MEKKICTLNTGLLLFQSFSISYKSWTLSNNVHVQPALCHNGVHRCSKTTRPMWIYNICKKTPCKIRSIHSPRSASIFESFRIPIIALYKLRQENKLKRLERKEHIERRNFRTIYLTANSGVLLKMRNLKWYIFLSAQCSLRFTFYMFFLMVFGR